MTAPPDPLRAYANAVRAGDRRLAALIASRVFRGGPEAPAAGDAETAPAPVPASPVAQETVRRLREHLRI